MTLRLYNTLTRRKEEFRPLDPDNVRVYVCGPTVYDYPHIGNARPVVVFDLLFRILRRRYGPENVTYVRNITDVDDKINARAGQDYPEMPLNEAIARVTEGTKRQFHADIAALACLPPTVEPCATEHIDDMKSMIEQLVDKGCAYVAEDHVLFHVAAMPDYGVLAHRSLDEMLAGARVEVAPYKRDAMDFVLWKPSSPGEPAWPAPCGIAAPGRPGWHIECSAMAFRHLGESFDIHGGGIDLVFPHHENELAQSRCALGVKRMASVWMHNGFLQVEGRKMAKSEGNFVTIHDLLHSDALGGHAWPGDVLRLALLMTHYRDPLDFSADRLQEAAAKLDVWASLVNDVSVFDLDTAPSDDLVAILGDDLNTPQAMTWLASCEDACRQSAAAAQQFAADVSYIGCFPFDFGQRRYDGREDAPEVAAESIAPRPLLEQEVALMGMMTTKAVAATQRGLEVSRIEDLVAARTAARAARDFARADAIRGELEQKGIVLRDGKNGTSWEVKRSPHPAPHPEGEGSRTRPGQVRERLYLYDTTLRDGQQTPGVDFSLEDKRVIAGMLDDLGLDYIEGGYPGANPTDSAFFAEAPPLRATLTAFGMTKRPGRSTANDPGLQELLRASGQAVCFVSKAWDYHVRVALGISNEENLEAMRASVEAAVAAGKEVLVDCEHFFDGWKGNRDYALACARTAYDAGARWVVLCDTNGGTLPHEVEEIVSDASATVPSSHLGIHAHNDLEQAVANSLAAVRAGVRHIQGTLNGIGERCGNANLVSIIPTLLLKPSYRDRFETGIDKDRLATLTHVSRSFDELLNRAPNRQAPYVGESAFTTKAGIHASAIAKAPETYEHVPPETVGNRRRVLVSDQAGKSNLLTELARIGIRIDKDDRRLDALLGEIKEREAQGYAYEAADASFEILARRRFGTVPGYFEVEGFRVMVEHRHNALGELVTVSEAVVKLKVDGESLMSVGEGNGPVNALDTALRKDLGRYSAYIEDLELVDYKVRILNGGTGATTRVLIESRDGRGERWFTVGVSPNIVDASFQALIDSVVYKLLSANAPAPA